MTQPALCFERPHPPAEERANLVAYVEQVKPNLTKLEADVLNAMREYFTAYPQHADVTGKELADHSGLAVTSIRPRLTGLAKRHEIRVTDSTRDSRADGESRCHAYYLRGSL